MTLDSTGLKRLAAFGHRREYAFHRAALLATAAAAFAFGLSAASAAGVGQADPGVITTDVGAPVLAVARTGFGWVDGIRPGQIVTSLGRSDDPGGWQITTVDGTGTHVARASDGNAALQSSVPLATSALVLGAIALLFALTRRQWVMPTAALGLVLAATPLVAEGTPALSTLGLAAAALVPGIWVTTRHQVPRPAQLLGIAALLAALCYWAAARLNGLGNYDELEVARGSLASFGTAAIFAERAVLPRLAGEPLHVIRPRPSELASAALLVGIALVGVFILPVPPIVVVVIVVAIVIALPTIRRQLRPIEDAVLADVRRQAALEGAEEERAKLARDLHDVPLQELIGVIRRLDVLPGAERESDDLRALAGHLRGMAIDLRPPVLDDLGLGAALQSLCEQLGTPSLPVVLGLDDQAGLGVQERPPAAVEAAMFRIATEALTNAIRHARATRIHLDATVAPRRVEVRVSDNGRGIPSNAGRRAVKEGHLGLASMRRRAEAIDADLSIHASSPGTLVEAVWAA